jgi:hypothetical protein
MSIPRERGPDMEQWVVMRDWYAKLSTLDGDGTLRSAYRPPVVHVRLFGRLH